MVLLVIADKNNCVLDILAVWSADLCVLVGKIISYIVNCHYVLHANAYFFLIKLYVKVE